MRQPHERSSWRETIRDLPRKLDSWAFKHKSLLRLIASLSLLLTLIFAIYKYLDSARSRIEGGSAQINREEPFNQRAPDTGRSVTGADQKTQPEETKRFTVVDSPNPSLVSLIEKKTGYIYDKRSRDNRVHLTYTGAIQEVNDGLYWYGGGYLQGQVDDFSCFVLRDVTIEPTLRAGNPRPAVENQLRKRVTEAVSENRSTIASKLVECFER